MREAFHAFKSHEAKKGLSPRLADQLFFVSYGLSWCSIMRKEAMRNQIENNEHAPAMFRVNTPVSNSEDFAKAFKCPVGSNMNPKKKCLLW